MGKPLSRPDCLRQNPSCVGKGEEEDLNIDDCYVPQRSIMTQCVWMSKLTRALREAWPQALRSALYHIAIAPWTWAHLWERRLGLLQCLGAPQQGDVRLDERVVFDGLKLNGDIIRGVDTVLCKPLPVGEKREPAQHRRSWRTFAPTNLSEYGSCSGTLCNDGTGQTRLGRGGRGGSMTNSLTLRRRLGSV